MDGWQKTAVIIAILTFIRLIIKDLLEYIEKRNKKRHPRKKKRKKKKR